MLAPFIQRVLLGQGAVIAHEARMLLMPFTPASRFQELECLPDQPWPVADRAYEIAVVDIVERGGFPRPVSFSIVDVERKVGRQPTGLDCRQVCADDLCAREHVGEIYRPDPRACAEIQDFRWLAPDGCPEENVTQQVRHHRMLHVEAVGLCFIVGKGVFWVEWIISMAATRT
jgi:hypothetical protein